MNVPPKTVAPDQDLPFLTAAKSTSQGELFALFDLYAPTLYNFAFFLCGSTLIAEQIVREAFAHLSEDLLEGREQKNNPRFYLFGTTYHLFVDETKIEDHPMPNGLLRNRAIRQGSTDHGTEYQPYAGIILQAFRDKLKSDQRHVVVLRFIAGLSMKETAVVMGKTVANVKVIQNRAMVALRGALAEQAMEKQAISFLLAKLSGA